MKNLAIIYGSPRTATTFLHDALIQHKQCFGGTETNENSNIRMEEGDTTELDRLWEELVLPWEEDEGYLVLKAGGYGFAYHYFNDLKDYNCKYLFVDRDSIEVIDSMMSHDMCLRVIKMELASTDCPKERLGDLWQLWEEGDAVNRSALHYIWHVEGIDPDMKNESLSLTPYKTRRDGKTVAGMIERYLRIDPDPNLAKALSGFYHRTITKKRRAELESKIVPEVKKMLEGLR